MVENNTIPIGDVFRLTVLGPLYKGKAKTIANFLIENNLCIDKHSKIEFLDYLEKTKNLSRSYKYQYTRTFDILISKFDNCYINIECRELKGVPLPRIINDFIAKTNANSITAKRYRSSIRIFYNLHEILNHKNLKFFVDNYKAKTNTKKQYLRDLKSYAKFLYDYSYIDKLSFIEISRIKIKGGEQIKKDILTNKEFTTLLEYAPDFHKLEIALCFYSSLRYHETRLYKDNGDFLEVRGKGNKKMDVGISNELRYILNNYQKLTNYETFSAWLKGNCKHFFGKHITTHCLRTSFAILLYQKTNDIQLVKRHLRHDSINTTSRYLNHMTNEEYLNKIKFS